MTNAVLAGYPEVVAVDGFQSSGAKPGKFVVDTLPFSNGSFASLPRVTSLTMFARNYSGGWGNLKVVKKPRLYGRKIRTVFADSRWRLKDVVLTENYNERDCNGVISPDTEKTIQELIEIIATASNLTIVAGAVPDFKPLAAWRGKRADEALDSLLTIAGLRMVYNPVTFAYVVSRANSGSIPAICDTERLFRPGPPVSVRNVIVHSGPKTFEGQLEAEAVVFNEQNEMVPVQSPTGIFSNFPLLSGVNRSRHIQTAFRLWRVDTTDRVMLGRRALSVATGGSEQTYAGARFMKPALADVPQYVPMVQPTDAYNNPLGLSGGGKLFVSEHPYISAVFGTIRTTATILCAWYEVEDGKFKRETETRSINPAASGDLEITADWIRPVESSEDDVNGAEWSSIHSQIATAIAQKYTQQPQHITVATLVDHGAIGQLGAVRYVMSIPHRFIETSMAFNFDPVDSRGM